MKAKSLKLRTLITLIVLWKHTDESHRLNTKKLNVYLKPYGLECTRRVLADTVRVMREYGIDVKTNGSWDNIGVWLDNKPLRDDVLDKLIFAIATNPYLSKTEEKSILNALYPLVSSFQEEKLSNSHNLILRSEKAKANDKLLEIYSVIQQAISCNRRVIYKVEYIQYDKKKNEPKVRLDVGTLFTPRCIYQTKEKIYMFGYNHPDKKMEAVELNDIAEIKPSFKHTNGSDENQRIIEQLFETTEPRDFIIEEKQNIVYSGPIVFYCRGQYGGEIYKRFGAPSTPLIKDPRCRVVYPLNNVNIYPETLLWLASIDGQGIRIKGPQTAKNAIYSYLEGLGKTLIEARLPNKSTK